MNQLNILKAIIQFFKIKVADLNKISNDTLLQVANKLGVKLPKGSFSKKVASLVKAFNEFAKKRSKFQKNLASDTTEEIFNKAYNTKTPSSLEGGETGKPEVTKYIQPAMGLPPTPQEFLVSNLSQTIKEASDKTVTAIREAQFSKAKEGKVNEVADLANSLLGSTGITQFLSSPAKLKKTPGFDALPPQVQNWLKFQKGEIQPQTFLNNIAKIDKQKGLKELEEVETEEAEQIPMEDLDEGDVLDDMLDEGDEDDMSMDSLVVNPITRENIQNTSTPSLGNQQQRTPEKIFS